MLPPFLVKSNMAATGQREWSYLRNFLAYCHNFDVYYKVYEATQSIVEVVCGNKSRYNKVTTIFNQI